MTDGDKSRGQLIAELRELRERVAALEAVESTRRRTEEELAKTQAVLSAAIECLPFDFFAVDTDGRCILQNAVSRRLYGDALGKTSEQVCPDTRALRRWQEGTRRALAGESFERETEMQLAGERRHFYSLLAPIQNESIRYGMLGVNVDITATKQAEEALRQSEARYRALAESTRDLIYILDRDGTIQYVNQAASQCIGIPCSEIVGKRQADLFPPAVAQAHIERIERVFTTGEVLAQDELFHFGPEEVWLRVHLLPVRGKSGGVTSVMGLAHNITERKRAEEALQKAHEGLERRVEERTAELASANERLAVFQQFAEASSQGFSMTDFGGRFAYLNPAFCRMLEIERPEEYIGQHFSISYSEETTRRGKDEVEPNLKKNGYWEGELSLLTSQGKSMPTWHHAFVIRDGQGDPLRLAAVITDITERKAAEEALAASEERFRAAFEEAPVGMVIGDANGRIVKVNRAFCEMTGFTPEDMIGHHGSEFNHPDDTRTIASLAEKLHSGAATSLTAQVRHLRKNGGLLWTEMTAAAIRGPGGKVPFGLAIVQDITERKRAQDALEQERRSLWRMLQASDHERQIISYEIHDGLAQYLAGAGMQFQAHDALRENSPGEAGKAYATAVELVRQALFEARRLVSEVRPPIIDEDGVETALSHLVHEQRRHGGPKIKFHSDVQFDRLPRILENAVYRIVQEALTNACKHSKSKKVRVTMTQQDQDVRLEVRDWGIGFDPDSVEKGRFGLEGIRQRVRLLGGRLTVESNPGSGTSVRVVVPILET